MVNGFRYYRALESVSIASALPTAVTIHPCQIRVCQRWQSKLQLTTARKKEWRPATAGSSPQAVNTVVHTTIVGLEPTTFRLLVDCWSDALPVVPPTHPAVKHSVPDRIKPSFLIFDIRALWRSALSVRVLRCQKLQMNLTGLAQDALQIDR